MKEVRVAEAVIPALKDKSIERDFRTLKRDRLVADIPICEIGWHHEQFRPGIVKTMSGTFFM